MQAPGTPAQRLPEAVASHGRVLAVAAHATISALEHELEGASLEDVAQLCSGAQV